MLISLEIQIGEGKDGGRERSKITNKNKEKAMEGERNLENKEGNHT